MLNARYALLEIREWRTMGAASYLSSPQNMCDMALIVNVFGLGVSMLLVSSWAPVLGSLGAACGLDHALSGRSRSLDLWVLASLPTLHR